MRLLVRILLAGLTAVLAINLWTGAPLFAIWVGSRVQKGTGLTMSTVLVVMAVLAATVALLVLALTRVEAAYKTVTGQETHRRTAPWLRSMRDERAEISERQGLTGFEKSLAAAVVLGVVAFEGWFFFFAGSSIG
ncbi:MAG TPA: hypothetical protein VFL73_00990 [Solirubrobacteraceae bacterium]|jgi:hypothetical protein|nr:hypothetical protein [Solirubrobacteraceae bacterium]